MSNARNLAQYVGQLIGIAQQGGLPTGALVDFTSTTLPSGFIWADGATLTGATPYTALRALYIADGFPHGQDGSGNPKVPDHRGRVSAGKDNMGGTAANRLTTAGSGVAGITLGAAGGAENVTLTGVQSGTPSHSHTASSTPSLTADSSGAHTHPQDPGTVFDDGVSISRQRGTVGAWGSGGTTGSAGAHTHTVSGSVSTTVNAASAANASQSHNNTQPTLVLNKIIKT